MEQSEVEKLVGDLELRVDRLRSLYDQYFMGIERIPPAVSHKDVERRIQVMRKEQIRNTGLRFRFQMLIQRYNTYQSYWIRIARQIEEGTYKRDLMRAKKRVETQDTARISEAPQAIDIVVSEPPPPMAEEPPAALAEEPPTTKLERPRVVALAAPMGLPPKAMVPPAPPSVTIPGARPVWRKVGEAPPAAPPAPTLILKPAAPAMARPPPLPPKPAAAPPPPVKPAAAPPPPAEKPAPPPPAPAAAKKPGDLSDDRMRQLYADFVQTKRAQKESTAALTYDALARTIRDSTAKLREKHAGKTVDFEVTVKDGKTILKPVVK